MCEEESYRTIGVYLNDLFETENDVIEEQIKYLKNEKDKKLKEICEIELSLKDYELKKLT